MGVIGNVFFRGDAAGCRVSKGLPVAFYAENVAFYA